MMPVLMLAPYCKGGTGLVQQHMVRFCTAVVGQVHYYKQSVTQLVLSKTLQ